MVGTLALLLLALALRGFERFAGPFIGSTARLVRRPLMLGFASALYVGFGLNDAGVGRFHDSGGGIAGWSWYRDCFWYPAHLPEFSVGFDVVF